LHRKRAISSARDAPTRGPDRGRSFNPTGLRSELQDHRGTLPEVRQYIKMINHLNLDGGRILICRGGQDGLSAA
jgi:hypothetical protein